MSELSESDTTFYSGENKIMKTRSILVTGTSTGLGKACALYLDEIGFKVYAGVRKTKDAESLKKEGSENLQPVILDVTKTEDIQAVIELISQEAEYPLFGLVNNAGIAINSLLEATPEADLRHLLEVNVVGLHAVTRACLPLLRKSTGRVINIGSIASFLSGPGLSSYSASKSAVRAISDALRLELKPFGMCVSLVAPGVIKSDIYEKIKVHNKALRQSISPELIDAYQFYIKAFDKRLDSVRPIPAIEVAKAVGHSLTSAKPKYLYLVGKDARTKYTLLKIPKRLFNWLVIKEYAKSSS